MNRRVGTVAAVAIAVMVTMVAPAMGAKSANNVDLPATSGDSITYNKTKSCALGEQVVGKLRQQGRAISDAPDWGRVTSDQRIITLWNGSLQLGGAAKYNDRTVKPTPSGGNDGIEQWSAWKSYVQAVAGEGNTVTQAISSWAWKNWDYGPDKSIYVWSHVKLLCEAISGPF